MKAKILERTLNDDASSTLLCEIFANDGASLGTVTVTDGNELSVRRALLAEATRLQTLPVGMEIEL